MFKLAQQLKNDCVEIADLSLSKLLLFNDSNYPWCILVPMRESITELYELSQEDQELLIYESSLLSAHMKKTFHADKMNIATIGNQVPQLHIHHVARFKHDKSWPEPVWGKFKRVEYTENILAEMSKAIKEGFI